MSLQLELLDGFGCTRQAGTRCLLGLRRTPETLAEEKLDRGDPRPNVRDLDLDSLLLAAARAGRRDPHLPRRAQCRIEESGGDVIERSSCGLREPRTNLGRVGMAVPARERGLDLSDERLGHGVLPPSRVVSVFGLAPLRSAASSVSMVRNRTRTSARAAEALTHGRSVMPKSARRCGTRLLRSGFGNSAVDQPVDQRPI